MSYTRCRFGYERSIINDTLLGEQCVFSAESRLPLEEFSYTPAHSRCALETFAGLVAIGQYLMAFYLQSKVHFRRHLGFVSRYLPGNSYLALSTDALQTMHVWS